MAVYILGSGVYNYNFFQRRAPVILLHLKYNFNNFKEEKKSESGNDESGIG